MAQFVALITAATDSNEALLAWQADPTDTTNLIRIIGQIQADEIDIRNSRLYRCARQAL